MNYSFLFWAYNIVWLGLSGYILFVFLRMKRLDRRLEGLEREVASRSEQAR